MLSEDDFYKDNENDLVWWVEQSPEDQQFGVIQFSFDRKTVYNLFQDYPYKLTPEQKAIFDKENPFWADFFKDRATA